MIFKNAINSQKGGVAVILVLGIAGVGMMIIANTVLLATSELEMSQSRGAFDETFYAAEAGLNEGLYRLQEYSLGDYEFSLDNITVNVTITPDPLDHYARIITARATDGSGKERTVSINVTVDSFATGFDYAIQGGAGGIYLNNNSQVLGDAYSNGPVLPASGGATGHIDGDVWVANDEMVDKVIISGNAYADTINRSTIAGEAYYQTIDEDSKVAGAVCPHDACHPGSSAPPAMDFPLDEDDVNEWKADILASGNPIIYPNEDDCPPGKDEGYYCVIENTALGNVKIAGDFYVGNGSTLNLTGNIWIIGNIILDNNGTIRIDPSLGRSSVAIITDGRVDVNNNYVIAGSGEEKSFILLVSLDSSLDPATPAIYAANNSASIVFTALNGVLRVKNGGFLNVALAEELWLEPNSQVIYNSLLSVFTLSTGAAGGPEVIPDSWEEL